MKTRKRMKRVGRLVLSNLGPTFLSLPAEPNPQGEQKCNIKYLRRELEQR